MVRLIWSICISLPHPLFVLETFWFEVLEIISSFLVLSHSSVPLMERIASCVFMNNTVILLPPCIAFLKYFFNGCHLLFYLFLSGHGPISSSILKHSSARYRNLVWWVFIAAICLFAFV